MKQSLAKNVPLMVLLFAVGAAAQDPGSNTEPLPPDRTQSPAGPSPSAPPVGTIPVPGAPYERQVSFNPFRFAGNFFSDEKQIWTFPAKVVTGHHVLPALTVAAVTAALVAGADPSEARYFRRDVSTYSEFNSVLSERNTDYAILGTPAIFYFGGLISRDSWFRHTGMLAAEAWVDSEVLNMALRSAAARERPADIPVNGNFSDTWFRASRNPWTSDGSFPSGHTTWAFSIFTVIAHRYSSHKWVPWLAYSLGGVAALSRLTASDHFLSDAFFGAVEGYTIARFVVLRQ